MSVSDYRTQGVSGGITATDGKVGALVLDGTHFITSPNQNHVPKPPFGRNRKVFLRENSLYGDDDPMLWPQPYNSFYCHHAAIPRPCSLSNHQIIWWKPTEDCFDTYTHSMVSIPGLGKLSKKQQQKLQSTVSFLISHVIEYTSSVIEAQVPSTLGPLVKMVEHGMARLQTVWMNFRQVSFSVRDVQRCWLEITAILDYMTIFKPRMDSMNTPPHPVATTIGVFTMEVRVAQDFFHAGLPCWLIRPASAWSDINILNVVPLSDPDNHLVLEPHRVYCPPVYVGPATSSEKYHAIQKFARGFLRYPDPFGDAIDEEGSHVSALSLLGRAASLGGAGARKLVANPSRSRDNRTQAKTPYEGRGKTTSMGKYLFLPNVLSDPAIAGQKEKAVPTGRNKFLHYDSPLMPLPIPAWSDVLQAVNHDQPPLSYNTCYVFPEAALFASTNESHHAKFFVT